MKKEQIDEINEAIKPYKSIITVTNIPLSKNTESLYKTFGIKQGYYLVRPDMYIAFRNNNFETEQLESYLARYFIK